MAGQLAFYEMGSAAAMPAPARIRRPAGLHQPALCAACRSREARYGFRNADDDPSLGRPRTLDDARKRPGEITDSSSGIFGASHVPMEMLLHAAGSGVLTTRPLP